MANADTNAIINAYLQAQTALTDIVGTGIYCPRLPEGADLPAVSYFTRGGLSNPHIPGMPSVSVQFDCWAEQIGTVSGTIGARAVYNALQFVLQGIQNQKVTIDGSDYYIKLCVEEVSGQDLVDQQIITYFKVMAFYSFLIAAIT